MAAKNMRFDLTDFCNDKPIYDFKVDITAPIYSKDAGKNEQPLLHLLLLEIPLYMARKCHPKSEQKSVEWRLIFPIVECDILLSLPYTFKKEPT